MLLEVFYEGAAWTGVHIPDEGWATLHSSGLLNVFDRRGRCTSAASGVIGVLDTSDIRKDFKGNPIFEKVDVIASIARLYDGTNIEGPALFGSQA